MFVWEFFDWLLLVYKDKFVFMRIVDWYMLEMYGRKIIRKFCLNVIKRVLEVGDDVIFLEFIEYILKEGIYE